MSESPRRHDRQELDREFQADGYAARFIRAKARQFARRGELDEDQREDIQQELTLDLLRRMRHYDPARGRRATFYRVVIERGLASILEHQKAPTRTPSSPIVSLQEAIRHEDGKEAELGDTIEGEAGKGVNLRDLCIDLEEVLGSLSPKLRRLCRMLPHRTTGEIARDFGVDRRTINRWKAQLQERFKDAGLDIYL
jgi:RNA polymerase sigma-70 factor (ECF subfamily)